jgi:citrate synthase
MSHIKHLLTDPEDPDEVRLFAELKNKYYEFIKYKMEKVTPEFPGGIKYDDTWRYRYPDATGTDDPDKKEPVDSKERRKLALRFHPDKCGEEDAHQLFSMIWEADDQTMQRISEADDPLTEARKALHENTENIDEELDRMLRSYPYNYHYFPTMFIPIDEYERKRQEAEKYRWLKEEQDEMRDAEKQLRELNAILKADKDRASEASFMAQMNSPL